MKQLIISCPQMASSIRTVMPAKAGIQCFQARPRRDWMPDQVRHDKIPCLWADVNS
jgi:hypothetical protein